MRRGQALVVVLLVLGVALTVGLSIISRSITEVSVSTTQDESSEALSVAEAGIEKALGGVIVPGPTGIVENVGNGTFNLTGANQSAGSDFVFPDNLEAGDVGTIMLEAGNVNDTFTVCLGQPVPLEIMGYYRAGATVVVMRDYVASPGGVSNCPGEPAFASSATVSLFPGGSTPLLLRIRPLGGPVAVGVRSSGTLPAQGQTITSTGQVGVTTQKIQVTKLPPDLPPMFDHALFSGSALSQ